MRLSPKIAEFFKSEAIKVDEQAELYLYGSRTDDKKKGGDIDLMILSEKHFSRQELDRIRWNFYKRFGMQKLDLLNFRKDEKANFKALILLNAIKL